MKSHMFRADGFQNPVMHGAEGCRVEHFSGFRGREHIGIIRVLFVFFHQNLHGALRKRQQAQGVFRFWLADNKLMVDAADAFGNGKRSVLHVQIFPEQGQQFSPAQPAGQLQIEELEQMLGSGFIRTDRATLVAAKGIHAIGRQIELINGETLDYAHRRKRQLREQLRADWRQIAQSLSDSDAPATREDYQRHYASYDSAPFAFTDIEMVFNEKRAAVDWIFRYANEALARLEKKPLEQLIDRAFGSSFPNMDDKWLRVYERTALFGETLEIIDHSPEIDTDLKIICFPTFKGHCGCILFKQAEIQTMREHTEP